MFNCRKKKDNPFVIKYGLVGRIRLFFWVLCYPWDAFQAISGFMDDFAQQEAIINNLREEVAKLQEGKQ